MKKYNFSPQQLKVATVVAIGGVFYYLAYLDTHAQQSSGSYLKYRLVIYLKDSSIFREMFSLIDKVASSFSDVFPGNLIQEEFNEINHRNCTAEDQDERLWKPRCLAQDIAFKKMWKNSQKAIYEHQRKEQDSYISYLDVIDVSKDFSRLPLVPQMKFKCAYSEAQGLRDSMEDAWCYNETNYGVLAAVFDGHGGDSVSRYTNKAFFTRFYTLLRSNKNNVYYTLEQLFDQINSEVYSQNHLDRIGSTATVCYIDKSSNIIYTATLGDSEANIYRCIQGQLKSIPLSCVRDWSCSKDSRRAARALGKPSIEFDWPKIQNPKSLRYPRNNFGVNISRAIGDKVFSGSQTAPAVIHKPKITAHKVLAGDLLVIACDGLKDFVSEQEIINVILKSSNESISGRLKNYALGPGSSTDNITVLDVTISSI